MGKVIAKEDCRVAPEGGTTYDYKKGSVIPAKHAEWMLDRGLAKVQGSKKKQAAPENKATAAPETKG